MVLNNDYVTVSVLGQVVVELRSSVLLEILYKIYKVYKTCKVYKFEKYIKRITIFRYKVFSVQIERMQQSKKMSTLKYFQILVELRMGGS